MPLLPQTQQKKQQILIYILILVVVVTSLVLYFGFFRAPILQTEEQPGFLGGVPVEVTKIGAVVERIKSLIQVLDDPLFKSLKVHGDLPVKPDKTGRSNPFISY